LLFTGRRDDRVGVFAAVTAILGKLGLTDINSNLATFVRTVVILIIAGAIVSMRGEWQRPSGVSVSGASFLILSGVATGLSWLCYYRALQLGPVSMVAPVDKLSVVFVIVFPFLYLTTSQAPKNLLPPTFRLFATYNPVSYMVEGLRR
jgi:transporter family protein